MKKSEVAENRKVSSIVSICKSEGNGSEYRNNKGTRLLSIPGKVYGTIMVMDCTGHSTMNIVVSEKKKNT